MNPPSIDWVWDPRFGVEEYMWQRHRTTPDHVYAISDDDQAVHTGNSPRHSAPRLMLGLIGNDLYAVPYDVLDGPGLRYRAVNCYPVTRPDLRDLYWRLRDQQDKEGW